MRYKGFDYRSTTIHGWRCLPLSVTLFHPTARDSRGARGSIGPFIGHVQLYAREAMSPPSVHDVLCLVGRISKL